MTTESRQVRDALAGDPTAFGELVVRFSPLVYSVLLAVVRRREPLDDLAQEVFVKAFQARANLQDPTRFGPWLGQIARRTALDWSASEKVRANAAEILAQDDWRATPDDLDDALHRRNMGDALWQAMDALDESSRQLLLLRHVEGCSYRDVACFLGISIASVYHRTRRAEGTLAKDLLQILRGRPEGSARRLALQASVLGALALSRPAHTSPHAAPVAAGHISGHTAWKVVAACLGISVVVHTAGLLMPGVQSQQDLPVGQSVLTASDASIRLTGAAPDLAAAVLGRHQDPMEEALLQPEAIPAFTADAEDRSMLQQLVTETLMTQAGADTPATHRPTPAIVDDTTGTANRGPTSLHVALHPVRLRGAGSFSGPGNFLDDLYRFLPTCCGITVEIVSVEGARGFFDPRLLAAPIHFLFQGGGESSLDLNDNLRLGEPEERLLRQYLNQKGFLYFEGDAQYLQTATALLRRIAPQGARLISVPQDHQLYSSVFDLTGGFPGEHHRSRSDSLWAKRWQLPPIDLQRLGWPALWGVEHDGRLLAVLNGQRMFGRWQPDTFATKSDSIAPPIKEPLLRAAANIVAYAMHRRSP